MKKFTRILSAFISLTIVLSMSLCFPVSAAAYTEISVTKSDIDNKGIYRAVQDALNNAKENATSSKPYKVIVPKGTYTMTTGLKLYSNTWLVLNGVTLIRNNSINLVRAGEADPADSGATGYDAYKNITIEGGTLDGNYFVDSNVDGATIAKFSHGTNITIKNTTFKNENNGHIMEVASIDGLTITGCKFSNQKLTPGKFGYEAIQLDINVQEHFANYRSEDLPLKNVVVDNCTFTDCPRGVGSHTAINNAPLDNIKITNCTFTNMTSCAIQGLNWKNCTISNNTITNATRGISVFSVLDNGGGVFSASFLANEGSTTQHVSDKYIAPSNSNIVISNNTLKNIAYVSDKYVGTRCAGIQAIGYDLSKATPANGIAKGNYYLSGVTISGNTIEFSNSLAANGDGIRLDDARNVSVSSNTIICNQSKSTSDSNNYYGIAVYGSKNIDIKNNSVSNSNSNGIHILNDSYKNTNNVSVINSISGNTVKNCGAHGISAIEASTVNEISNNKIDKSVSNGIHIRQSTVTNCISDNVIKNAGYHGINIEQSVGGKINANTIQINDSTKRLISLNNGTATIGTNYLPTVTGFKTSSVSSSAVKLTWSKVSGAQGYIVYKYDNSKKTWVRVAKTTTTANTYTVSKLSSGTSYKFAVKAYRTDNAKEVVSVSFPTVTATTLMPTVTGFKTSSVSSSAVKLTWNKVSGAQGYIVYEYDNSKKTWVRVAKTTTTANTYTVSKLASGTSYKFAVKAYKTVNAKEITSSSFPTVTVTTLLPAATGFKTSSVSSSAVKLTWSKVSGAQGYIVYKYDNSKKTWVRVAKTTTTANTYTVSKLSSGTSYKFAVKPYKTVSGKEITSSSFPTVTAITKLPTVVNGTPTVGKNSVKLTWKKTTGATGYIVYKYDNSKKTWVRVTKTSSLNYTVKSLKSNTSYKFTVKAYKTVSGKEITSASFTPISVKTKK